MYIILALLGLGLNGLLWFMTTFKTASVRFYRVVAILQITLDLALASAAIYSQGGLASRATILYAIPIFVSGILLRSPAAFVTAAMSGIAYGGTLFGYLLVHTPNADLQQALVPAIFYPCMFLLLAAIITRFSALNATDEQEQSYRQLLAMLHHQLLHPSSVIAAIVDMLEHDEGYHKWTAKDKEYMRQLKRENLRLNTMITNVLESARDPEKEPLIKTEPINILQVLNDSAVSCAVGAKRIMDLDTNLPHQKVSIHAQPEQIRTAFDNVIENAFRYSEEGTPVKVSLDYEPVEQHVTVTVEDKGKGMSSAHQKELFHLFTQLQEQSGRQSDGGEELYSLGLGLYVSKVIVERHHGSLEIKSKEGVGTTVIIKIQEESWRRPEFYT